MSLENKIHKPFKVDAIVDNPFILKGWKERADEVGLPKTIAEKLNDANIKIVIDGDYSRLSRSGHGVLMAGDHKIGIESMLLMAAFSNIRNDIHFTAKPFSFLNHLLAILDQPEDTYTIPFMPRLMAKGRNGGSRNDQIYRKLFEKELLTEEEVSTNNNNSLNFSSRLISKGEVVNIFPAGVAGKDGSTSWQKGIGEIIKRVPSGLRKDVNIVLYKFEGARPFKIFRSLFLASKGIGPKQQEIILKIGAQGSIEELFPNGEVDHLTSREITEKLETLYKSSFL